MTRTEAYAGIIGYGYFCTVKNLTLEDFTISSTGIASAILFASVYYSQVYDIRITTSSPLMENLVSSSSFNLYFGIISG